MLLMSALFYLHFWSQYFLKLFCSQPSSSFHVSYAPHKPPPAARLLLVSWRRSWPAAASTPPAWWWPSPLRRSTATSITMRRRSRFSTSTTPWNGMWRVWSAEHCWLWLQLWFADSVFSGIFFTAYSISTLEFQCILQQITVECRFSLTWWFQDRELVLNLGWIGSEHKNSCDCYMVF